MSLLLTSYDLNKYLVYFNISIISSCILQGHELTIYTLYQLFAKRLSKEDPDSIAAASAMYDNFLLSVVRNSFVGYCSFGKE